MTSPSYDRLAAGYYNPDLKSLANPGGLAGKGAVRANWTPMLLDFVTVAGEAATSAAAALQAQQDTETAGQQILDDASAIVAAALGGATSVATSNTNVAIPAVGGTMTINIGAGRAVISGQKAVIARTSGPLASAAYGRITYNAATGVLDLLVEARIITGGAGPFADWNFGLSAYGVPEARLVNAAGLVTGGGALTADITLTVAAATPAQVRAASSATVVITPDSFGDSLAFEPLVDAATVVWDAAVKGYAVSVVIGGNRTIDAPSNLFDGCPVAILIQENGAGGFTPSFHAIWDTGGLGTLQFNTGANKANLILGIYNAALGKILITGFWKSA